MLAAPARLRRGSDIRAVSRSGLRVSRAGLTVHLLPAPTMTDALFSAAAGSVAAPRTETTHTRATVIVGKAAGGAVARNRLRRQVRHSLRHTWADVPPGADVIIRAKPPASTLDPTGLDDLVGTLLRTAAQRANRARS